MVENCTISTVPSGIKESTVMERVDLIKKGCPKKNSYMATGLSFRSITDSNLESNLFEVFRMRASPLSLLSCWVQVCSIKSKCVPHICPEIKTSSLKTTTVDFSFNNSDSSGSNSAETVVIVEDDSEEFLDFVNVEVRFLVVDGYKFGDSKTANTQLKQILTPDVHVYSSFE
jgi:hypothetical protein